MENSKRHRRRRRGLLALLMAATALISATGATMSLALFTDSQAVDANTFTSGNIDIDTNPHSLMLSAPSMMPGDVVNGSVVVSNVGSESLRYALSGSATDADGKHLAAAIEVEVKTEGTGCGNWDGATLFGPAAVPYAEGALFGNYLVHPNGGRTLAFGGSETLCFRATLPSGTPNGVDNATTTMTFTFYAEQTKNNP
jgi:predicted ribosomally synthesized peptide with SipW-like signal peptide